VVPGVRSKLSRHAEYVIVGWRGQDAALPKTLAHQVLAQACGPRGWFTIMDSICYSMRMLSTDFGAQIRNERLARGWTQAGLARAAKVSRTVLSWLEQGRPRPVQTDVLDRLFAALDVKPQLPADPALEARRLARFEQQVRLEEQRNRHLRLALALAGDRAAARRLIGKAKNVVERWRRNRTCSPLYIKRWSALLALPPAELAKAMAAFGEWENAMFQNTPWSWAWN